MFCFAGLAAPWLETSIEPYARGMHRRPATPRRYSCGEDHPYGHPSLRLLERLRQAGIPTLRTDTNRAIHIVTDGEILQVSYFVACPEITAQVNSAKPQTPQDQQSNQQQ
jgi:hypothetical protein